MTDYRPTAYDAEQTLKMVEREMRFAYHCLVKNRRDSHRCAREQAAIAKALLWQLVEIRMSLTGRVRR